MLNFYSANLPGIELGADFGGYGVFLRSTVTALSLNDARKVEDGRHSLGFGFTYDYKLLKSFARFDNYNGFYSDIDDSLVKKSRSDVESKNFRIGSVFRLPFLSSNPNAMFVSESSEIEFSAGFGLSFYYFDFSGQEALSLFDNVGS